VHLYTLKMMDTLPTEIIEILRKTPLPEWCLWLAQDSDGAWWAYQAEPLQNTRGWYENEIGIYEKLGHGMANSNWQAMLIHRDALPVEFR